VNCRRQQEFLSDFLEDALSPPLRRELENHLLSCEECRSLADSMKEVVALIASASTPEPPSNFVELVLERTRPALAAARAKIEEIPDDSSFWRSVGSGLAAAAVLALVLLYRPPEVLEGWSRSVSQTAHRSYSLGVRTYHRTARWIEDLNVLRMTVGVAFENRLDRLNERLRDLEELRRRDGGEDESSRSGFPAQSPRSKLAGPVSQTYPARSLT
jgi:hypothetical protein